MKSGTFRLKTAKYRAGPTLFLKENAAFSIFQENENRMVRMTEQAAIDGSFLAIKRGYFPYCGEAYGIRIVLYSSKVKITID